MPQRAEHFGSNYIQPPEIEGFWTKFIDALGDFMLKVLIVAGVFSIAVDTGMANPKERRTCK